VPPGCPHSAGGLCVQGTTPRRARGCLQDRVANTMPAVCVQTANAAFLMCIAFLPFATSLMAEYITESREEQRIVVLVYGGSLFAMAICFNVIWWYGTHHHGLLDHNASPRIVTAITGSYQIGFVTYLSTLVIAWFWPLAALAIYALLALFYALPGPGKEA
jgi:TMEM175 potassium channel family protein